MKRMHIHVGVESIEKSISFYSALFGEEPTKVKDDYAKWMLEDPRINFAISTHTQKGVDHLGIQVDEDSEMVDLKERLNEADLSIYNQGETVCCYAKSDKAWVQDPSGIAWETYRSMEDVQIFSDNNAITEEACCTPDVKKQSSCC